MQKVLQISHSQVNCMSEDKHVVDELEDRSTEDRDSTEISTYLIEEL